MNLLIVDDQPSVLDGLTKGIHFEELGINSVDTAGSVGDALSVLENKPIQIMMTDVEMPERNGLELNSIVREKYPDILRIILTSHARFSYVQTSLRLGCFDYIVQPAPFEDIEAVLKRAVDAVHVHFNNRRIWQYGSLFKDHESEFLNSIILRLYANDPSEIEECIRLLNESGHSVTMQSAVRLVFVDVFAYTRSEPGRPSQRQIAAAISDALQKNQFLSNLDALLFLNPHRQFSLLLIGGEVSEKTVGIEQFRQDLCASLPTWPLACYYGDGAPFASIQLMLKVSEQYIQNNVADEPVLEHITSAASLRQLSTALPDYQNQWSKLLYAGQKSLLKKEIYFCLDKKIASMPNKFQSLCDIHQQLIQMFFKYFYDNGIDINSLFTDSFTYRDCMDSFSCIEEVKRTLDFLLDAMNASSETAQGLDYVEKAKKYILGNYSQQISVKDVADYVHLNPEYFTKMFKKQTGQNIKNYIIDCKLTIAKELLTTSNLPVSMVALEVGYNNFSHFTQIFKKAENMTPSEYKLRVMGSEDASGG